MLGESNKLTEVKKELRKNASTDKVKVLARFFKTGKGEYGEGDVFLGVAVPQIRLVSKKFSDLDLADLQSLLRSKFHEERLLALLILVLKYRYPRHKDRGYLIFARNSLHPRDEPRDFLAQNKKADEFEQKKIYEFYLENTRFVNNWDLVDLSAEHIIGAYLDGRERSVLASLARSNNIWDRRIAILSTFHYIKQRNPAETFKIAEILINDKHDLIQKAVGWMLREVGKKCSQSAEEEFLRKHYKHMPRVMLRYAIERFDEGLRKRYLMGMLD